MTFSASLASARCLPWFAVLLFPPIASAGATVSNGPLKQLAGTWQGRSLCVTSRPACSDETVRYRISLVQADGLRLHIDADKLVEGRYESMGGLDCQFQAPRQLLVCPMNNGQWLFRWDGKSLLGSLSMPDQTLFRLIQAQRTSP